MKNNFSVSLLDIVSQLASRLNIVRSQVKGDGYHTITHATTVEPLCIVSKDLTHNEYLDDVLQTSLNIVSSYYLRAVPLVDPNTRVVATEILGRLNPNTDISSWGLEKVSPRDFDSEMYSSGLPMSLASEVNQADMNNNDVHTPSNLAVGKMMKVRIGSDEGKSINVDVMMRMHTKLVDNELVSKLLSNETMDSTFTERWHKMTSGSISFWGDFIWSNDLIRDRKKLMKMDEHNLLAEVGKRRRNSLINAGAKGKRNYGVTSNVAIISKDVALQVERRQRGKLKNQRTRDLVMESLSLMILAVVDTEHEMITFYYAGNAHETQLSLKNLMNVNKKSGPKIEDVMKILQSGGAPIF